MLDNQPQIPQNVEVIWKEDVAHIAAHYQQKLAKHGVDSPKSLGGRGEAPDFTFFDHLLSGVSLPDEYSVLDIGCGATTLPQYLREQFPDQKLAHYLGIDLVPEFIEASVLAYPESNFITADFMDRDFTVERSDLVIANGVLVSRVRHYEEYVEAFLRKMIETSSGVIAFNLITDVDPDSPNYANHVDVGRTTFFPREDLEKLLARLPLQSVNVTDHRSFPDATDTFVWGAVGGLSCLSG